MATYLIQFFDSGAPKTGLTPTVTWRQVDGTTAGTAPTVTEVDSSNAPGWYSFDAVVPEPTLVTWDAGVALVGDTRYKPHPDILTPEDSVRPSRVRHEVQRWDSIMATFEAVVGIDEVDLTGAEPTCAIQRLSDGRWYNDGTGTWDVSATIISMSQPAVQLAGYWEYVIPSSDLTESEERYRVGIFTAYSTEFVNVHVAKAASDVLDAASASYMAAGSIGEALRASAEQLYTRIENATLGTVAGKTVLTYAELAYYTDDTFGTEVLRLELTPTYDVASGVLKASSNAKA